MLNTTLALSEEYKITSEIVQHNTPKAEDYYDFTPWDNTYFYNYPQAFHIDEDIIPTTNSQLNDTYDDAFLESDIYGWPNEAKFLLSERKQLGVMLAFLATEILILGVLHGALITFTSGTRAGIESGTSLIKILSKAIAKSLLATTILTELGIDPSIIVLTTIAILAASIKYSPVEQTLSRTTDLLPLDINSFNINNENTMERIVHLTAIESEKKVREAVDFLVKNSSSYKELEDHLIEEFTNTLKKIANPEANIALRSLQVGMHSNNITPSFTNIKGYGMRNIVALYYKAIIENYLCEGTSESDAINALIKGISDARRGGNRNNDTGIDDGDETDHPTCGQGHYNKMAECLVSAVKDVELIFDIQSAVYKQIGTYLAKELLVKDCSSIDKYAIMQYWNGYIEQQSLPENKQNIYNNFVTTSCNEKKFHENINNYLSREFKHDELIDFIKQAINNQINSLGSINKLLTLVNLDEEIVNQYLQEDNAAKTLQHTYKNYKRNRRQNNSETSSIQSKTNRQECKLF